MKVSAERIKEIKEKIGPEKLVEIQTFIAKNHKKRRAQIIREIRLKFDLELNEAYPIWYAWQVYCL